MRASRSRVRRVVAVAAGALAVWSVALVVAGFAAEGCERRKVEGRIARSFEATAAFSDSSLSLLRGRFSGTGLRVDKDEAMGSLRVTVDSLEAELAPLGLALVDGHVRTLRLSGVDLQASSLALLRTKNRGGKPVAVDALELRDVHLVAMPTMLVPSLGRLEVRIERARAGPTVLRTALSWVFALRELVATIDLPGGVTVHVEYAGGRLRASGGAFGSTPVELPFSIPVVDPLREMDQLEDLGIELAKKITINQAERWLEDGWDRVKRVVSP